jgi:hypothetical protein
VFGSAKERDRLESQQASQIGLPDVYLTSPRLHAQSHHSLIVSLVIGALRASAQTGSTERSESIARRLGKKLGAQEAIGRASTQDESGAIA